MSSPDLTVAIDRWSIPSGEAWKLCIGVRVQPLNLSENFYRVHDFEERTQSRLGKDEWLWRRWSPPGTPTVLVGREAALVLDGLVLGHPDLSLLGHLFGYAPSEPDAS